MVATSGSTSMSGTLSINGAVGSVIDAIPTAAVITDRELIVIHANEQAGLIFGKRIGDIVGSSLIDHLDAFGVERGEISQSASPPVENAQLFRDLLEVSTPSGLHITTSEIGSAFEDGSAGYLFIFRRNFADASDKESVIELDRMLTRGDMAAEIVHEMNNFLTILVGNTELIPLFISNGNHEKAIDKLTVMKGTLGKIAGLSESLIEYGKQHETRTISDLNDMIRSTLEFFEPQNRFDGIEIRTNLAEGLPSVRGDIGKVQQLIGNLIHNAADELKAASSESKIISIATRPSEDRSSVVITVSDTGRGVDESIRDDIFRERCSTRPKGEGYGLLACKQIADDHSASISFDNVPGEGACFTVVVPAVTLPDVDTAQSDESAASGSTD